ncbi:AAA family ATPase [Phormidium pseudopriestleyi FRX01]|uniref:AAA family ATPase n=1 Tax=Phormidium pseudopriestleyi FRX01 TaxID=1759528 RepID=A0ABS3FNM3_9CYAN|nr:AAA family ATPase [Phormidium pseudopriestleyi]MBO0348236.1 AAA family ATPase [Phormidium pseudopriestleyi FRX01]
MEFFQQRLHELEIVQLKNIKDLLISFETKNITAILGPNGSGKSTIIHALACCFQPPQITPDEKNKNELHGEKYKFSNFFTPNTDAIWSGSYLKIIHSYRKESELHERVEKTYEKASDRWMPIYARQPTRNVYYFGVSNCVPLIETERKSVKINYTTSKISEKIIITVLEKASFCLNREYTSYNIHDTGKTKMIGVEADGIKYSQLSMSAGEQKIFLLLEKVFRAKKYSLILIDELDLLLHDSALKNLVRVISERAESHNLQVVFTTHRESILDLSDLINIRHIYNSGEKTLCFNDTKPDAIHRLTDKMDKTLELFVEDDLAKAIVYKIASQIGIHKHIFIGKFGAAINAFTLVSGLLLKNSDSCENSIFVLDGDKYPTPNDQNKQVKKNLTGNDENAKKLRASALEKIKSFNLPENYNPEKYIHSLIKKLDNNNKNPEECQRIKAAQQIISVNDSHQYIDKIINDIGYERSVGLSKIIDLASTTEEWGQYVFSVKEWLISKKELVEEKENLQTLSEITQI